MQVAVGENDEAAILGTSVFACLLLSNQRVFIFGLCFKNDEREAFLVEQQEVDKALACLFKVLAQGVEIG